MSKNLQAAYALIKAAEEETACVVLTVETTPAYHKQLDLIARERGITLDALINEAIRSIIIRAAARKDMRIWLDEFNQLGEEERRQFQASIKEFTDSPRVGRELI